MMAFFAGSFNPFTIGHLDLVARALKICPEGVVVGVGYNEHKCSTSDARKCADDINALFADVPALSAIAYSGLTAMAAARHGCRLLVRGFRNAIDAEYERNLADANRMISDIDTILLPAKPELATVSSSMVRELLHNGYSDVSRFIPSPRQCAEACGRS